jgi:hemerythrin
LIAYVVEHFAHEEKEMQAKNFSGYAAHKAEHDALVGICADLQEDTGALVKNWLDSHIPTFDRAYESTLNS